MVVGRQRKGYGQCGLTEVTTDTTDTPPTIISSTGPCRATEPAADVAQGVQLPIDTTCEVLMISMGNYTPSAKDLPAWANE